MGGGVEDTIPSKLLKVVVRAHAAHHPGVARGADGSRAIDTRKTSAHYWALIEHGATRGTPEIGCRHNGRRVNGHCVCKM